jgi:negative regulator of flagellin synthesis FlgM
MKIGSFESKPVAPAPASAAAERSSAPISLPASGTQAVASAPPAAAQASAQVALSPAAGALASAATDAASDPTFDKAKVERIASAIREGKFTIDAEAIADKLIVNAAELLGSKPN